MFVQLFEGWRYREGKRDRIASLGLALKPATEVRPPVPGLLARLVATETDDPDTGIGLWVWQDEAACRAYEANRPEAVQATVESDIDHSAISERTFEVLFFGVQTDG
jgi:hypothetical protein